MGHMNSLLACFPIWGRAYFSLPLEQRSWQIGIALIRVDMSAVITLGGVQIPVLGEHAWLVVIITYRMVIIAPAA
jgi:hypothetical protein